VLISAIRSGTGAAAEVIRLAMLGNLVLLMDFKLICEYRDVALRPEHLAASGRTAQDVETVIQTLEAIAAPVLVEVKHRPMSQDKNDDMILDLAINGRAHAIVTNNVRDFAAAAQSFAIQVLAPRDFLIAFRKGDFHHVD